MFDGSEDVNSAPVVNVLVRVMGPERRESRTFFLKTFHTGYYTCDDEYYLKLVDQVVEDFSLKEHLAGVVTENTGSVV